MNTGPTTPAPALAGVRPLPSPELAEALRLFRSGDRKGARARCESLCAANPDNLEARLFYAILLVEEGEFAAGIDRMRSVVAAQPNHAAAQHAMGRALLRTGRADEAAAALERAIANDANLIDACLELGGLHIRARRLEAAEAVLRRGVQVAPNHLGLVTNLGGFLATERRSQEGIQLLRRVVEISPSSHFAHYNLAIGLRAVGDAEGAIAAYRKIIEIKPDFADAYLNMGNAMLDLGRVAEAAEAYQAGTKVRRTPGAPVQGRGDTFRQTNAGKLRHDIEQYGYLMQAGKLAASFASVIGDHERALAALPPLPDNAKMIDLPPAHAEKLAPVYNRLVHWPVAPTIAGGAVNPGLDAPAIEIDYIQREPGITFFDNFLRPEALAALRAFCLDATVWYTCRYANGYLGAFMDDGFCCPLLLQIAEELRQALPAIFGDHTLRKLWAFKYDSRLTGIPIHADFAAVNVNFWVTPDEANLDAKSGGLVVWDKEAPLAWDFTKYNNDEPAIRRFLAGSGAKPLNVPYRQNRVVIFNSDLFHETGLLHFRDGYENRRINITMLYGLREKAAAT